jgi:hypothetical protein
MEVFLVIDCEFNRAHYPNLIGKVYEGSPPSYIVLEIIKLK